MLESWFVLAVVTAVVYGGQAVYLKAFGGTLDRGLVAWAVFAFGVPVYAAMLLFEGLPTVSGAFWLSAAVSLAVNLIAWPMFVRALQLSDVSLVMPLVALTPAFMLLVEWLVRDATPTAWGLAGILLIVIGTYVLNVRPAERSAAAASRASGFVHALAQPLRSLFSDKGAVIMLTVAAMWSVSATVEKIAVTSSSPAFYLTVLSGGFALAYLPFLWHSLERPLAEIRAHLPVLVGAGLVTVAMLVAQMKSLETAPLANYVIAIKRAGMLVSVLLGWWLFGERGIGPRMVGAALMIGGVVLIRVS